MRNIRNPKSLTGIDYCGTSHAVRALQLRVGNIISEGDSEQGIARLHNIIPHPACWSSTRDDRDRWYGRNVQDKAGGHFYSRQTIGRTQILGAGLIPLGK